MTKKTKSQFTSAIVSAKISATSNKQDDDFSQKIPSKTVYFETKTKEDAKKLIDLGLTQYTSEDKEPFFIVKAKAEMPIYFKDSDEKIMKNMSIKTVNTQTMEEETNPNLYTEDYIDLNVVKVKAPKGKNDFFRITAMQITDIEQFIKVEQTNPFAN